jgi:hypothetical protein
VDKVELLAKFKNKYSKMDLSTKKPIFQNSNTKRISEDSCSLTMTFMQTEL